MRGPRDVMMCHVSSWSGGWRPALRVFRPVSPPSRLRHGLSFPSVFAPFPPAAALNAADIANGGVCAAAAPNAAGPCFARIARPSARVSAGAVRAPDCARARAGRRAHFARWLNRGFISAPAPAQAGRGSGYPFSHLFLVYSSDATPECKFFHRDFSQFPARRLIFKETLPGHMAAVRLLFGGRRNGHALHGPAPHGPEPPHRIPTVRREVDCVSGVRSAHAGIQPSLIVRNIIPSRLSRPVGQDPGSYFASLPWIRRRRIQPERLSIAITRITVRMMM